MSIYSRLAEKRFITLEPIKDGGTYISSEVVETLKKLDQLRSENSMHKDVPKPKKEDKCSECNIYQMISRFKKLELEAEKAEKKKRKLFVCIHTDSVIGKEIQYQTALLHEILDEIRRGKSPS